MATFVRFKIHSYLASSYFLTYLLAYLLTLTHLVNTNYYYYYYYVMKADDLIAAIDIDVGQFPVSSSSSSSSNVVAILISHPVMTSCRMASQ